MNLNKAAAVLLKTPGNIEIQELSLDPLKEGDVLVENLYSGVSTGTERLLFEGRMPEFPGMGYPLVPGYECFGRVVEKSKSSKINIGEMVFVPGATCYGEIKGLFGGASSHLVVNEKRIVKMTRGENQENILLALAATAQHVINTGNKLPNLIIGHGTLGRLLARIIVLNGGSPIVVEKSADRRKGQFGYKVLSPAEITGKKFDCVVDVSGDAKQLDFFISLLKKQGELVLAGFYQDSISFDFVPTFLREIRLRVSAQWEQKDLDEVSTAVNSGKLDLSGLITHSISAKKANFAYETAFNNPSCLKMVIDWKEFH